MNERTSPILLTPLVPSAEQAHDEAAESEAAAAPKPPRLEPTRYGDWELNGKCVDF